MVKGIREFISIFLHLLQFRAKCVTRDLPIMLLIIRDFFFFFCISEQGRPFFPDGGVTEIKFTRVPWNHMTV
jgi:hypothetical protein